ncbi:MAG: AAA family ATPase [Clostridia bacterium]|jgi:hypothetical protein|nr:AAA family ATPase [Clostridia bacterium]
MIKSVTFKNFRNLDGKYEFNNTLNVIIGKNNSGKTNLLDGIKLAFSAITNDYFKISDSDFKDSEDNNVIKISVELQYNSISSLNFDDNGQNKCGFITCIKKTKSGRYIKTFSLLNGTNIDVDIVREDECIPNLYLIPLIRVEDIYTAGLTTGISTFIDSEERYKELKDDSKKAIKQELASKVNRFKELCKKFNENLDIELTDPKISDEKVYIVDGNKEHNFHIGSGYKSIANIMLNTLDENFNIILIDEIENHLHPALIRTLIRELRNVANTIIISTTHSSVVINELKMEEIIDISGTSINSLNETYIKKLNTFLHPGRNELMLADNIILVEGYTEEVLLKHYLSKNNYNWTIINVAGVMFEPYIQLASLLNKKVIVVSDNDKLLSDNQESSSRFSNLKLICTEKNIKLIEIENTLETDLYINGFLNNCNDLLEKHKKYPEFYVAKHKKKVEIAERLIENDIDLSNWHAIEEIENGFKSN